MRIAAQSGIRPVIALLSGDADDSEPVDTGRRLEQSLGVKEHEPEIVAGQRSLSCCDAGGLGERAGTLGIESGLDRRDVPDDGDLAAGQRERGLLGRCMGVGEHGQLRALIGLGRAGHAGLAECVREPRPRERLVLDGHEQHATGSG